MKNKYITKYNKLFYFLCLIVSLLALSSCAVLQPHPTAPENNLHKLPWPERIQQLNKIQQWSLRAALNIKYDHSSDIAYCNWEQDHDNYSISLSTPLNLVHFYIEGDKNKVTLTKSLREKYTASSPEKLLKQQLGWTLPITNLTYWIKGLPAPELSYHSERDSYNHLSQLKQQGWIINYSDYAASNNIDLPTRIIMQNKKIEIKVVIKNWQTR
jgi:outer membrane lipoprotein LolB